MSATDSAKEQEARRNFGVYSKKFPGLKSIGYKGVVELKEHGHDVYLIDCRTNEEIDVSIIPGSITQNDFEQIKELAPTLEQEHNVGETDESKNIESVNKLEATPSPLVTSKEKEIFLVPYCTIGYRSGLYAMKLIKNEKYSNFKVLNGEGILLWIHDGGVLTKKDRQMPNKATEENKNENETRGGDSTTDKEEEPVMIVHSYAAQWDLAPNNYETVQLNTLGLISSSIGVFGSVLGSWLK